jgi:hypothetical protein
MSRLFSTESTEYATDTDRNFPALAAKLRKLAPQIQPALSPTEIDQYIERWGAFIAANDIVLEREAFALFNQVLQTRMEKDSDVVNMDPPALYLRQRNVLKIDDWVKGAQAFNGQVGD